MLVVRMVGIETFLICDEAKRTMTDVHLTDWQPPQRNCFNGGLLQPSRLSKLLMLRGSRHFFANLTEWVDPSISSQLFVNIDITNLNFLLMSSEAEFGQILNSDTGAEYLHQPNRINLVKEWLPAFYFCSLRPLVGL